MSRSRRGFLWAKNDFSPKDQRQRVAWRHRPLHAPPALPGGRRCKKLFVTKVSVTKKTHDKKQRLRDKEKGLRDKENIVFVTKETGTTMEF